MRVLVTRPAHSAERTARRLREMGHEPLLLPLAEPVHDPDAALQALSATHGALAVTSAEAIRTIAELGDGLAPHLDRPLLAVGEATAGAARGLGFRSVTASSGSGRELAEEIARNAPEMILYLAGTPRAEGFEKRLTELGLRFGLVECYRMRPIVPDPSFVEALLDEGRPDAILFYSRRTSEDFFRIPHIVSSAARLSTVRLLCLSQAVAEAVPEVLRKNVTISTVPDENGLLSLL
ncbi:uroporphyrinogen-III synthase [Rhizobium binxianense]